MLPTGFVFFHINELTLKTRVTFAQIVTFYHELHLVVNMDVTRYDKEPL